MKTTAPASSRRALLAAFATLCAAAPLAQADTLTWDIGHTPASPSGTTGTWNTTTADWSNGAADQIWNPDSATADIAKFNVSANYTVGLNSSVYVGGLETAGTGGGVTISGSGAITLNGPATIAAVRQIDLNVTLQGSSGLVKTGVSPLRFVKAATYTGGTALNAGQITLGVNNALPSGTTLTMSNATFFTHSGFQQTIGGLASASAGNGTVRNTAGSAKLTISGATTDAFSGTLTDTSGSVPLSLERAGTGVSVISGANTFHGAAIVSGGELRLGSNLVSAGSVTVSGGTLSSTVANVNLGLGAFSMGSGSLAPGGASVGSFTLASGQAFSATGGIFDFTLGLGVSDQIVGSGSLDLSGVTFALSGATSVAGTYTLFSGFAPATLSGISITGLGSGFSGVLGSDGVLAVSAVPEPSAFAALAGLGVLGLAATRRRRR